MDKLVVETRKGPLTEEDALDSELDIIPSLFELEHLFNFREYLCQQRPQIEQLISRHLGIPTTRFTLTEEASWISGSFNICLPINIDKATTSRLPCRAMIRFPLPFNSGEPFSAGNMDEKLRCEAATYIWLGKFCPSVPIPRLLGMGFPGAQSVCGTFTRLTWSVQPTDRIRKFTSIDNESAFNRVGWLLKRIVAWWSNETLAPFVAHTRRSLVEHGYLLIEYVEDGEMLWTSWKQHLHDKKRRSNLYRGVARILLDLASIPQPRIGSWTMNDRGVISLTNRPLSDLTFFWSRHQIPTGVPRVCSLPLNQHQTPH